MILLKLLGYTLLSLFLCVFFIVFTPGVIVLGLALLILLSPILFVAWVISKIIS